MRDTTYRHDQLAPSLFKQYEGLFAQGNGYLQLRGTFEEGLIDAPQHVVYERRMESVTTETAHQPLSMVGTYVPIIVGMNPNVREVVLNLPNPLGLRVWADGERFDMVHSRIMETNRELDMTTGRLRRHVIWQTVSGCLVQLEFDRFASAADIHLLAQRLTVASLLGSPHIVCSAAIDAAVTTNGHEHFTAVHTASGGGRLSCQVTTDLGFQVSLESRISVSGNAPDVVPVEVTDPDPSRAVARWGWTATPQVSVAVTKLTGVATSRDPGMIEKPAHRALDCADRAMEQGWDGVAADSDQLRIQEWQNAALELEGPPEVVRKLNLAVYHLLRCTPALPGLTQICAKGFSGTAYYGRYFWDTEVFMLPFYLWTNPAAARGLVAYRFNTLPGARENARVAQLPGAKFAWQSGMDGTEQCALWEYADDEIHITADVAYAVLRYVAATGDQEFLRDCGLEILIETARFWAGRVDRDDAGRPHLLAVMGPDEYTPMSRDNAFTNHLVKYTLGETARLLSQAVARGDGAWRQLCERLEFDPQEIAAFEEIARDLPVPFDSKRNLVLQCADFEDYAPIDIDGLWDDRQRAFGHSVTLNKLYRSRVIKQADVIQLMTMRPHDFTDDQVRTAYRYYAPLTVHDSSLSPAAHSIAAARIGDWDEVDQLFRLALAVDFDDAAGGAAEGIHIANCGCLWQLLVGGLAGFDFDTGEVTRTGSVPLPGGLTRIAAHLVHGDEQKTVVVSARPSDEENTDRKRQK